MFSPAFGAGTVLLGDPRMPEISGCAVSPADRDRVWLHNDSGNPPWLFAVGADGRVQARVEVAGATGLDWEDIAAFRWQGAAMLAIADTGDNFAWRDAAEVLLLPEPPPGARRVRPSRTIRFRYPDGPRDLEALAVDAAAGQILLLEKRRPPARLYGLALNGPVQQLAQPLATLPDWWPEPATPVETFGMQRYRGAATAMDLSPDGRRLAILTPTHWMVFDRRPGETWTATLARKPRQGRIPREPAGQRTIFEALCWAGDGGLWISGEGLPAPLLHLPPP